MIIVALGLMMDARTPRPYYANDVDERPRRELALQTARLSRSHAHIRRKSYRAVFMHRRSDRAPVQSWISSPLRAA